MEQLKALALDVALETSLPNDKDLQELNRGRTSVSGKGTRTATEAAGHLLLNRKVLYDGVMLMTMSAYKPECLTMYKLPGGGSKARFGSAWEGLFGSMMVKSNVIGFESSCLATVNRLVGDRQALDSKQMRLLPESESSRHESGRALQPRHTTARAGGDGSQYHSTYAFDTSHQQYVAFQKLYGSMEKYNKKWHNTFFVLIELHKRTKAFFHKMPIR